MWKSKKALKSELSVAHTKCEEMGRIIDGQRKTIETLKEQNLTRKKKISGDRVCDGYCQLCKHSLRKENYCMGGVYITYSCALDCKCKDFEAK